MHRIVYRRDDYLVKEISTGFYVYNRKRRSSDEHTHIKTLDTSIDFIGLLCEGKVPDSKYLRKSVLRICRDKKLIQAVLHKIEKDKQKQNYYNPQKGVVRK